MKIQLKLGQLDAQLISQHNSLVQIVNQALGGKDTPSAPSEKPAAVGVDISGGVEKAVINLNRMLNFG